MFCSDKLIIQKTPIEDPTIQIEEPRVLNLLLKFHLNQTMDQRDISFLWRLHRTKMFSSPFAFYSIWIIIVYI